MIALGVPTSVRPAAKAACLAAMLLGNAHETLDEIRTEAASGVVLSGDALTGNYERLRALRKTAPEAYYYWCAACGYLR